MGFGKIAYGLKSCLTIQNGVLSFFYITRYAGVLRHFRHIKGNRRMDVDDKSADAIRQWDARQTVSAALGLLETADNRSGQFQRFAETLTRLAPGIQLSVTRKSQEEFPAFLLEKAWRYHLVPQGAELKPFLELIEMITHNRTDLPGAIINSLKTIRSPAHIKIYVAVHCPHCRRTVNLIKPLPIINPLLRMTFIDGQLFPEMVRFDKIRSVPTVICNEQFRWIGRMRLEELIRVLARQDPEQMGKESFKAMINNGDAARLAEMMIAKNQIFPAFLETLLDPEWPTRLGAMVVFEQITERAPSLARRALGVLWEKLPAADGNVKGDMLYLAGKAGDKTWIPRLALFTSPGHSESLREAAQEALDALKGKA